ncbi:Rad2-like endonuclease, putative [Talaromyces stipitatus ATCC 10500]|uniref:Rad2-like endonuclease, putative n=1 Tax=Talaromyces stipitatus (strain ATCC 10500 / CBS 375.48 / QM 6759 / NRRL 1006) TaxID=441959 RepID=B8M6K5_TALSN|nr:Rad2-like endonuclease, putative [Talaromyces stipitatus ATCC 10500]EED19467.1 Rad2-like endonuclease, putative [Talaromyces stipitatus ATCC 10500]
MGIPGYVGGTMSASLLIKANRLGKAIGNADRIALSRLAVRHLEVARRPIRIAVDISIWLFQLQAGRGGQNPELRTLFFRLVRLLALPVHPLFVYDGKQKPPFKRGKATTGRSYGNAPIINLSKILIDLFKFPRHDAPGEAEAECARLQQAGVVDAVMSNDIDTLMFGSGLTVMNYSKESSTGTTAATHVDCYATETQLDVEANVKLSRAGMVLFAMLSGGDYLPSGVTKCGPGLAGEIAKAGFGEDLFEIIYSNDDEVDAKLAEWRERLQYELDENESGYFQSKHKAVRIPDTFPDRQILSFYAKPVISNEYEIEQLRERLVGAWDHEINALELRKFVAEYFEWKYRSGAKKLIRNLAEPLILTRLRLARSPIATFGYGSYVPNADLPILQRIYRSRMHFSTGCIPQVQVEMIPVDVVGLDLDAEEPNPPPEWSQATEPSTQPAEDEDEADAEAVPADAQAPKYHIPKHPYNPFEPEKIWVFETVANLGIPDVVERWKKQEAEKKMPKKPAPKKATANRKKKVIDPSMKPGGILRYTTVTKPGSDMNSVKKAHILDAAGLSSSPQQPSSQSTYNSQYSVLSDNGIFSSQSLRPSQKSMKSSGVAMDELVSQFSVTCSIGDGYTTHVRGPSFRRPPSIRGLNFDNVDLDTELESIATFSPSHSPSSTKFRISYTPAGNLSPLSAETTRRVQPPAATLSPTPKTRRSNRIKAQQSSSEELLVRAFESLRLSPVAQSLEPENLEDAKKVRKSRSKAAANKSKKPPSAASKPPEVQPELKRNSHVLRSQKDQSKANQTEEITDLEAVPPVPAKAENEAKDPDQTQPQPRKTFTETIRTYNGFWTVDLREEDESSLETGETQQEHEEITEKGKGKKKRIARVSLLDMR